MTRIHSRAFKAAASTVLTAFLTVLVFQAGRIVGQNDVLGTSLKERIRDLVSPEDPPNSETGWRRPPDPDGIKV